MSKLGYISKSYGKQFNIAIANTYSNNILQGSSNLPENSLIISSNVNDNLEDTGTYSLLVTDFEGNPERLTYTIQEGSGLYYDSKIDALKLNIDNKSIKTSYGKLFSTLTPFINEDVIKSKDNNIYINNDNITIASENEFGISKIDNKTIKIDEGTIYVNSSELEYSNNSSETFGIGIGDSKTIIIDNGKMKVNTDGLKKANNNEAGIVKPDNVTVNSEEGILSVNTQELKRATKNNPGIISVDGKTIISEDGIISVKTENLTKATSIRYGIGKVNLDQIENNEGIISIRDYYTIKEKLNNFVNYTIEYNKKIDEFNEILKDGTHFYKKDDIIVFAVNETSVTSLDKPKYQEEVIKMIDQYVNVDFNIITTCDFNISVIFKSSTNEFPSVTLTEVNYNDEFIYEGEKGILQETVYPSTNGELKKLTLKFWAKNFSNSVIGESLVTTFDVTASNVNDIKKQKSERYSIIRYNSLYDKFDETPEEEDDSEYIIHEDSIVWRWSNYPNDTEGYRKIDRILNWCIDYIDIEYDLENVTTTEIFHKVKEHIEVATKFDRSTDVSRMSNNNKTRYRLGYNQDKQGNDINRPTAHVDQNGDADSEYINIPKYFNNLIITVTDTNNGKQFSIPIILKGEKFPGASVILDKWEPSITSELHTLVPLCAYVYYKTEDPTEVELMPGSDCSGDNHTDNFFITVKNELHNTDEAERIYPCSGNNNSNPVMINEITFKEDNEENIIKFTSNPSGNVNTWEECILNVYPWNFTGSNEMDVRQLSLLGISKRQLDLHKESVIYNLTEQTIDVYYNYYIWNILLTINRLILQDDPNDTKYNSANWYNYKNDYVAVQDGELYVPEINNIYLKVNNSIEELSIDYTQNDGSIFTFGDYSLAEAWNDNPTSESAKYKVDTNFVTNNNITSNVETWEVPCNVRIYNKFIDEELYSVAKAKYWHPFYGDLSVSANKTKENLATTLNIYTNPKFKVNGQSRLNPTFEQAQWQISLNQDFINTLYTEVDSNNANIYNLVNTDSTSSYLNLSEEVDNFGLEYSYYISHIFINDDESSSSDPEKPNYKYYQPNIILSRITQNDEHWEEDIKWSCQIDNDYVNSAITTTTYSLDNGTTWNIYDSEFNINNGTTIISYIYKTDSNDIITSKSHYNYSYAFCDNPDISNEPSLCLFTDNANYNNANKYYLSSELTTNYIKSGNINYYKYSTFKDPNEWRVKINQSELTSAGFLFSTLTIPTLGNKYSKLVKLINYGNLTISGDYNNISGNDIIYIRIDDNNLVTSATNYGITIDNVNNFNASNEIRNPKFVQVCIDNNDNYTFYSALNLQSIAQQDRNLFLSDLEDSLNNIQSDPLSFALYDEVITNNGSYDEYSLSLVKDNITISFNDFSDLGIDYRVKRYNGIDIISFIDTLDNNKKINLYEKYSLSDGYIIKYNINTTNINNDANDINYYNLIYNDLQSSGYLYINLYYYETLIMQIAEIPLHSVLLNHDVTTIDSFLHEPIEINIAGDLQTLNGYWIRIGGTNDISGDLNVNATINNYNASEVYGKVLIRIDENRLVDDTHYIVTINKILTINEGDKEYLIREELSGNSLQLNKECFFVSTNEEDISYYNKRRIFYKGYGLIYPELTGYTPKNRIDVLKYYKVVQDDEVSDETFIANNLFYIRSNYILQNLNEDVYKYPIWKTDITQEELTVFEFKLLIDNSNLNYYDNNTFYPKINDNDKLDSSKVFISNTTRRRYLETQDFIYILTKQNE